MTDRQITIRLFIILILISLCGCAHIRYGDFEYWRLGKQEIAYLSVRSEPNSLGAILMGHRGGENIKPSVKELLIGDE